MDDKNLTPEQQEQLLKLQAYLVNNADRIKQWAEAHSKEPGVASNPPVYWNPVIREFYWLNRANRRKRK